MDESHVIFQGSGPFALPAAQSATKKSESETVSMTLYSLLPERGSTPVPVHVPMTVPVARHLAEDLTRAAVEAEIAQRKKS